MDSVVNWKRNLIGEFSLELPLIESILQDFKNKKNNWTQAHSSRGYMLMSSDLLNPDLYSAYSFKMIEFAKYYSSLFPYSTDGHNNWTMAKKFNLQYYPPGKHYSVWHCENNGEKPFAKRHLAFMTYLNTVNSGGETEFFYQNTKFQPVTGHTLIWPAYFTHTHRGIPAETEEKYIVTGWFEFVDQEKLQEDVLTMDDADFYKNINRYSENIL